MLSRPAVVICSWQKALRQTGVSPMRYAKHLALVLTLLVTPAARASEPVSLLPFVEDAACAFSDFLYDVASVLGGRSKFVDDAMANELDPCTFLREARAAHQWACLKDPRLCIH